MVGLHAFVCRVIRVPNVNTRRRVNQARVSAVSAFRTALTMSANVRLVVRGLAAKTLVKNPF